MSFTSIVVALLSTVLLIDQAMATCGGGSVFCLAIKSEAGCAEGGCKWDDSIKFVTNDDVVCDVYHLLCMVNCYFWCLGCCFFVWF
jgi:hypothetical protein